MSHVSMAVGSVSIDDSACSIFEANRSAQGVNAKHVSKVWCIPHDEAAPTLKVTTQSLRHDPDSSLSRNVGTNDRAVGNICAQLFVSDKRFVVIYPMKKQSYYFFASKQFAKDVGAPDVLVCDPHPAQTKREVREFCTQIGTTLKVLEAETQWANHAELYIGLIKEAVRKDM
jgi:hypothetical protein